MNNIIIYSTPECPYCNNLKELLNNDNITYIDKNVNLDENKEEYEKVSELSKSDMIPLVLIKKNFLVPNVSFNTIKECYEIIKKLISD
jgi:glutaredoxin